MVDPERVLLLDGRTNAALGAVRSLGKHGLAVICAESFRSNPTFFSRHATRKVVFADPDAEPEAFLADLEAELSRGAYHSVIPIRGVTTRLLVENRERFAGYVGLCLPGTDAFSTANDKGTTARAARTHGVPIPRTFLPEDQSLESIASTVRFPALIKPRISSGSRGIVYVRDSDELSEMYPVVKSKYGEPIIQEYIRDEREDISAGYLLNENSELRGAVVWKKVRQFPVRGGPTALGVTVDRPELVELGYEFLRKLGWRGVAGIGFVIDPDDHQAKLIEINPRFWMTLPLAIHAGVDFPYLLHRVAVDGDVEPVTGYRIGARCRWFLPADILWLLNVRKSGDNVRAFLRFRHPDQTYSICSVGDPGPMAGAAAQALHFARSGSGRDFILKRGW